MTASPTFRQNVDSRTAHWSQGGMNHWVTSDVNVEEYQAVVRAVQLADRNFRGSGGSEEVLHGGLHAVERAGLTILDLTTCVDELEPDVCLRDGAPDHVQVG